MVAEKKLYDVVRRHLLAYFGTKVDNCYLYITSEGVFPEEILGKVPEYYDIIFSFLKKKNSPDLTGFIKKNSTIEFITVEIKDAQIKLEDIYQAKRYADLFKAKYGILVSTKPIPTIIKRLCKKIPILYIAGTAYEKLKLAHFDVEKSHIIEKSWFPESPFK